MLDNIRAWLSVRLINMGIWMAPDEQIRMSLQMGMSFACSVMIMEDDDVQ